MAGQHWNGSKVVRTNRLETIVHQNNFKTHFLTKWLFFSPSCTLKLASTFSFPKTLSKQAEVPYPVELLRDIGYVSIGYLHHRTQILWLTLLTSGCFLTTTIALWCFMLGGLIKWSAEEDTGDENRTSWCIICLALQSAAIALLLVSVWAMPVAPQPCYTAAAHILP